MFKRNTLGLGGAALCGALLVSGCANQMSQRSEHEERVERKLLDHSLQIDVGEPKVLELPQRRVQITSRRPSKSPSSKSPVVTIATRLTNPGGNLRDPAGCGRRGGRRRRQRGQRVRPGQPADSMTKDWLSYGIAGLNPFMNVQSNGRAQQNLAGIDEVQRDKRVEYSSLPWSERPVEVKAGKQTHD
jgi:hypothetical protein